MNNPLPVVFECNDVSEKIDFYETYGFYIKPIARLNITIQLPPTKTPGQVVSNAEIIEKIKKQSLPDEFIYLRVIKTTFEFIRCEGEIENKSSFKTLLSKLDGCAIKMNAFTDVLKVRAAESKIVYPTRHDWDSFFKDTQNPLNELKPGERPDTIHLADLPCKWFTEKKMIASDLDSFNNNSISNKPSVNMLRDIFSIFGEIRMIDIPSTIKKPDLALSASSLNLSTFEAFIQYKDYISFVKAMDTFRGMKLLYIEENKQNAYTANIRVDFDRTRHLSDDEIKKREIYKLKSIELEKIRNAQLEKEKDKEAKQKEIANFRMQLEDSIENDEKNVLNPGAKDTNFEQKSKEIRRREREEIRRQKRINKKQQEEDKKLSMKIALEERKILIAQRKLESMRLLEELFNRVKVIVNKEDHEKRLKEIKEAEQKREQDELNQETIKKIKQEQEEQELKEKILKNLTKQQQREQEQQNDSDKDDFEFELRKTTMTAITNDKSASNSPDNNAKVPMPRALILSQQQLQKPQLYDDDEPMNDQIVESTSTENNNIEVAEEAEEKVES